VTLVFADDLRCRGPLRVWWNALREFLHVALPHTLSHPALRVPIIGVAVSILSLSAELVTHYITHLPPRFAIAATFPSFAPVLLPCVVIWACRGRAVSSLDLKDHQCLKSAISPSASAARPPSTTSTSPYAPAPPLFNSVGLKKTDPYSLHRGRVRLQIDGQRGRSIHRRNPPCPGVIII
jgi:hypothetical protein